MTIKLSLYDASEADVEPLPGSREEPRVALPAPPG